MFLTFCERRAAKNSTRKSQNCDEERDQTNRLEAPGDSGLISHLKLMEEEVKMRIIDTQLPLTCLPIKLISFCRFIN